MQTLYIDVYFLINFTVDLLSLHFASLIAKVSVSGFKLIISSLLLSALAVVHILFIEGFALSALIFALVCVLLFLSVKGAGGLRRLKYTVAVVIFMMLIGGIVHYMFELISKYFPESAYDGNVNRGILILSVIILLCVGSIKLAISLFSSSSSEKSVCVRLELVDKSVTVEAFVDTGNLLTDPIDSTPVMLVKTQAVISLFPYGVPDIRNGVESQLGKHIRLIPINKNGNNEIKLGIRPTRAAIIKDKREEEIRIIFIVDEEGGTFAGYNGLIPASVLDSI